jgi:hypothetical protein
MKSKNIFFGIFLISIGILWMLKALDVISFSWYLFFKLWPLILIWVGIKLMPIQDKWKVIFNVAVLFIGIAVLLLLSNSIHCKHRCTKYSWWDRDWNYERNCNKKKNDTVAYYNRSFIEYDESFENANLQLDATAGKLVFTTGKDLIAIKEKESASKIIINSTVDDNSVNINAKVHPLGKVKYHNSGNYKIQLNSAPVWEMDLELDGTAGEIDFSDFKIKKLDIESNASALSFKLGNLYADVKVNVESNASAVDISLPHDMKCTLKKAENNLSSLTVKGLKQESKNYYVSDNEEETAGIVNIVIASNVSSVEIKRY